MTNQQGAPEALEDHQVRKLAAIGAVSTSSGLVERRPIEYRRELEDQFVRGFRAAEKRLAALVEAQQPAAHVQNPAEIEHVQGDVSKNGVESNMAQQPAPSAAVGWVHPDWKADQGRGRIYGHNPGGYVALVPMPQADSQPAPVRDERDDFEKAFPLPSGCIRCGTGYTSTGYSNWAAHTHVERWNGWQARAARAPADSVTVPAGAVGNLERELAMMIRRIVSSARRNCEDDSNVLKLANDAWTYLVRKGLHGSPLRDAGIESDPTQPAQAADSVLEDAALLHYALADGGNQRMNWQDIYDDWNGEGNFIDALRAAYKQDAARKQGGA